MRDAGGIVTYVLYELQPSGKMIRHRDFPHKPEAVEDGKRRSAELGGFFLVTRETYNSWRSRNHATIDVVWRSYLEGC